MKNIAFEISIHPAQYCHFIALAVALEKDSRFSVSYFTLHPQAKQKFLDFISNNGLTSYFENIKIDELSQSGSSKLKNYAIKILKATKIESLARIMRLVYTNPLLKKYFVDEDVYKKHWHYLNAFDYIATTELNGSELIVESKSNLIWLLHGILSNPYVLDKSWKFDMLVSPQNNISNFLGEKSDSFNIFGSTYIKFETIKLINRNKSKLFNNDNHTFMYNPHWDNRGALGSWFTDGESILEYFVSNKQYNLIFAPHINIHSFYDISWVKKYAEHDNIIVDIESDRLTNGYYFEDIDTYIGDVSSQFFEIASYKEISAIFLNLSNVKEDKTLEYWSYGDICRSLDEFRYSVIKHANHETEVVCRPKEFEAFLDGLGLSLLVENLATEHVK
ncbi:hypothetical protein AB4229_15590 [Vibrio breoganii]